jgi:hypothetical protein
MAGQLAGFNVLQIINEATAAALAYGLDKLAPGSQMGLPRWKLEISLQQPAAASTARGHQYAAHMFPIILATTSGFGSLAKASKAAEPRA